MPQENAENNQNKLTKSKRQPGRPRKYDITDIDLSMFDFDFDFTKPNKTQREKAFVRQCAEILFTQGFTPWQVKDVLHLNAATVHNWYQALSDEKKREIEANVLNTINVNVGYFVNATLISMSRTAHYCSQKEYIEKHSPEKLGELFEIIGNQTFKIIESNQRAQLAQKEIEARSRAGYIPPPTDEAVASASATDATFDAQDVSTNDYFTKEEEKENES